MKSSNKILTISVILLLLVNVAMVIFIVKSRNRHDNKKSDKGDSFAMMDKDMKLTEAQKAEVKKFRDAHFSVIHPLSDSLRSAKEAFFGLLKEPNVSDSVFSSYSKRILEIQDSMDKLSFAHLQRIRNLFDPAQQIKYDEYIRKMVQKGGKDSTGKRK
ncbi:MAG: Spy/CpxP family protein refolding chaperone [Bacteroidia bacterium]|nr:Spy/CpxP family protein refolding chaperone [Bacteroidia bacterium]